MAAARFFIDAPLASGTEIELPDLIAHHAKRVLRLRDGAAVVLFNGAGGEFAATLSAGPLMRARIGEHDPVERESPLTVTLVQSWIANDKLDWMVEKAVELGVHSIVLAPARRSVVRLTHERAARKVRRLRDIAIAACSQCGRNQIPSLETSATLTEALLAGLRDDASGMLLEPNTPASQVPLSKAELRNGGVALAIGPEGGFDNDEIALAQRLGYRAFRLGPRILRTETAGVAALVALQSAFGDLQ